MRGRNLSWFAVAVLVAATVQGGARTSSAGCAGAETDLAREPAYRADYLHRFTNRAGCPVRLDVIMWRDEACVAPADIVITAGSSVRFDRPARDRSYLRAPALIDGERAPSPPYAPAVPLPPTAVDTGYHRGHSHLWITPADDSAIYLAGDTAGTAERWPLDRLGTACA